MRKARHGGRSQGTAPRPGFATGAMMRQFLPMVLACVMLAGLAVFQIVMPTEDLPAPDSDLAPRRPAPSVQAVAPDYPEIDARPLFSPDRRPAPEAGGDQGEAELTIVGIGTAEGAATALLRVGEGGSRRIRPGDEIEGWHVDAIEPDRVVLSRDGETRVLTLASRHAATPATPAAAPSGDGEVEPATAGDAPLDDEGDAPVPPPPSAPPGRPAGPPPDKSWLPPAMQNMPGIERFIAK